MMQLIILTLWLLQLLIITANNVDSIITAEKSTSSVESSSSLFTRYDRNAYHKAAGHPPTSFETTQTDSRYGNLDKAKIKRQLQRKKSTNTSDHDPNNNNNNNKCTTYLAPSSIPNSGLGMYTTTSYTKGSTFPLPEIGILLQDKDRHYPQGEHRLLSQYPWGPGILSGGTQEVTSGAAIVPGLGMLANSHLGLANIRHDDLWRMQLDDYVGGTHSLSSEGMQSSKIQDVGRGSTSLHSRVLFHSGEEIQSGEELFVNYGDEWFTAREEWIGVVPGKEDYVEADRLIETLSSSGNDGGVDPQKYEELLKDSETKDKRLRAAFPDNVEDVPLAKIIGTARLSARSSIQSIEWLEENGACIDNLVSGASTIPQAGRGAFASRNMNKGAVITTTPLITLEREALELWEEVNVTDAEGIQGKKDDDDKILERVGHQLLLNYCYGHTNSSLLLFPYSPTVNFINHGSKEEANAEIVWSSYPYHKKEWLEMSLPEMKELKKTGLMFDIVATKDISLGEEVLLYYGKDWENSWSEHVEDWTTTTVEEDQDDVFQKNMTDTLGENWNQQNNVDSIIWTVEEQDKTQPYPTYLETVCRFQPPEAEQCKDDSNNDYCTIRWSLDMNELHENPCDVISRSSIDGNDWYFVRMNITNISSHETTQYYVEFLPRYAIRLVNRKYTKDQYTRGVFREVIGLLDGIFPDHWMDLKGDDES